MTIPVYINQNPTGTLTISREGLYTAFAAELPGTAGLVRLWAHGEGKSAYLGVMEPSGDGLTLRRRLSRRELEAFPDPVEYASDRASGEGTEDLHNQVNINEDAERGQQAGEKTGQSGIDGETEAGKENPDESLHNIYTEQEPAERELEPKRETDARACPWPAELPEEGLLWYRRGDGSLTSFDGVSSLLAIPAELRAPSAQAMVRVIEGKKYLVFRY